MGKDRLYGQCTYVEGALCNPEKIARRDAAGCTICQQMHSQADQGGNRKPESSNGSGPFWTRIEWLRYTNRSIRLAENNGCGDSQLVKDSAERLTSQKEQDGTLVGTE